MILGPLGDVINTSGVFRTLKKAYPNTPLSIITIPAGMTASYGIPEISNRYLFDRSKKGLKGLLEIWKFAFANHGKFETIVILDTSFRSAHLAFMCGAKRRIGRRGNLRTPLLTGSIPFTKEEKNDVYVAEYYARCLKPLGLYEPGIRTSFAYTKEDEQSVEELLKEYNLDGKKLLGFCPACGQEIKTMRAEDAARDPKFREKFDYCTARAVARMNTLSEYCLPLVKVGGIFLAYKSGDRTETEEARVAFSELGCGEVKIYGYELPEVYGERTLVAVKKRSHTPGKYPRSQGLPRKKPLL